MTEDTNTTEPVAPSPENTVARAPFWRRPIAVVGVTAVVLAGAGAVAVAQSGWGSGHFMEARFGGFAERRFERMLDEIDATKEQSDKLMDIFDRVREDVMPKRREMRGMRDEAAALLLGPTVDPAAVEAFRAKSIAELDATSKQVTAALVEAAQVLTPEQRAELKQMAEKRRGHHDRDDDRD